MAHGYLGDGYGSHGDIGSDREDDGDRRERDWRGSRDRNWRGRNEGMMFGDRDRSWSRDDRSDFRGSGREDYRGPRDQRSFGGAGDYSQGARGLSAHPDDHYRSWRDRHMSELDRDYQDYCREREQQFHSDFDSWRRQRHGNPQPLRTGMTQTGLSHDPSGELQLETEATPPVEPNPMADATLGTNGPAGARSGRGRR